MPRIKRRKIRKKRSLFFRKKVCVFCKEKIEDIDYKDTARLSKFVSERGKMVPRRVSGTCARHQRRVARAVKRARFIAFLPFIHK